MFAYFHVKWFCGQSECAYYLNYFINHFQDITFDIAEYVPVTCKHFQRLLKVLQWISNSSNVRSGARRQTWGDYIEVLARSLPRRPLGLKRKKNLPVTSPCLILERRWCTYSGCSFTICHSVDSILQTDTNWTWVLETRGGMISFSRIFYSLLLLMVIGLDGIQFGL